MILGIVKGELKIRDQPENDAISKQITDAIKADVIILLKQLNLANLLTTKEQDAKTEQIEPKISQMKNKNIRVNLENVLV